MRLLEYYLPRDFNLYDTSDVHKHNPAHHEDLWYGCIDNCLSDPDGYMIIKGDLYEAVLSDDYRYSKEYDEDMRSSFITDQRRALVNDLMRIAESGKLLAIGEGNHERKHLRFGPLAKDVVDEINDRIGKKAVDYMGYTSKIAYRDKGGNLLFKHYATHGSISLTSNAKDPIQRDANLQASLKNKMAPLAGDCAYMSMGHTHKDIIVKPVAHTYLYDDGENIKSAQWQCKQTDRSIHPDHRWYCNTSSFLKTQVIGTDTYSEIAQYPPLECVYPVVKVRDGIIEDIERVRI